MYRGRFGFGEDPECRGFQAGAKRVRQRIRIDRGVECQVCCRSSPREALRVELREGEQQAVALCALGIAQSCDGIIGEQVEQAGPHL